MKRSISFQGTRGHYFNKASLPWELVFICMNSVAGTVFLGSEHEADSSWWLVCMPQDTATRVSKSCVLIVVGVTKSSPGGELHRTTHARVHRLMHTGTHTTASLSFVDKAVSLVNGIYTSVTFLDFYIIVQSCKMSPLGQTYQGVYVQCSQHPVNHFKNKS